MISSGTPVDPGRTWIEKPCSRALWGGRGKFRIRFGLLCNLAGIGVGGGWVELGVVKFFFPGE